jgi:crossover junction endodeoxyribonuclease RusA
LSPNARVHWAKLASVKKTYRLACAWQAKEQGAKLNRTDRPVLLEMEFYKPNRRAMDRDNLLARMKAGLDGVCDALGIDDRIFSVVTIRVSDQIGGFVKVRLFEEQ